MVSCKKVSFFFVFYSFFNNSLWYVVDEKANEYGSYTKFYSVQFLRCNLPVSSLKMIISFKYSLILSSSSLY